MDFANYQQDTDTLEQVNAPKSQRSQLELEQRAREIVEDKALLACVLDAAAQLLRPMTPVERKSVEETDRSQSPPPAPQPRTDSLSSHPHPHSPYPHSSHHPPPQSPPLDRETIREAELEWQMFEDEHTTPRQSTFGHPTICQSAAEHSRTDYSPASEIATGRPTSGKPRTGQPRPRQPIPRRPIPGNPGHGQPIPGLFIPNQPATGPFSHGQFIPGQYTAYRPSPGQYPAYQPTSGQYTPAYPPFTQYAPSQYMPNQHTINHPTPNQFQPNQPPTPQETEQEKDARELEEYIAHGYDEEMKGKYPEHFMRRRGDGTWALRED